MSAKMSADAMKKSKTVYITRFDAERIEQHFKAMGMSYSEFVNFCTGAFLMDLEDKNPQDMEEYYQVWSSFKKRLLCR